MLQALLGELSIIRGSIHLPTLRSRNLVLVDPEIGLTETVAYCAQQAWLLNATIKNNILFASPFNERRYKSVITACALQKDLEILEAGDETEVGEKGITLSGGQKQRISLARALYSSARYLLLDDCLSAVDSHTAQWIHAMAINGPLVSGRTRILVTHNIALCLPTAKHVVVLENGQILGQGGPEHILDMNLLGDETTSVKAVMSRSQSAAPSTVPSRVPSQNDLTEFEQNETGFPIQDAKKANKEVDRSHGKLVQDETKSEGSVDWRVYRTYMQSVGGIFFWVVILLGFVLQQVMNVGQTYWIRNWARSYGHGIQSMAMSMARPITSTLPISSSSSWIRTSLHPTASSSAAKIFVFATTTAKTQHSTDFYIWGYLILTTTYVLISFLRTKIV